MKPSFWQSRNKRFLTFKPLCMDECEETRLDLLNNSRNILINETSLQELLIYHSGLDSQNMSEQEIDQYLKDSIRFSTLVNVFQGFLFHNTSTALKKDYAATLSKLLYQKGLMFTVRDAIGLPDVRLLVSLSTSENGKLIVEETVASGSKITDASYQPAMVVQHRFSIQPDNSQVTALTWQQDDPVIQFHQQAMATLFSEKILREKIIRSVEEILDSTAENLSLEIRP